VDAVEEEASEESDLDDEEEGGAWITPENLLQHIGGGESVPVVKKEEEGT